MVSIRHRVQRLRASARSDLVWYYDMTLLVLVASFLAFLLAKQLNADSGAEIRYVRSTANLPETKPQKAQQKIDVDVNEVKSQLELESSTNVEENVRSSQSDSSVTMSIEENVPVAQDDRDPIPDQSEQEASNMDININGIIDQPEFVENANMDIDINGIIDQPREDSTKGSASPTEGKVVYRGSELSYYQCGPIPALTEIVLLHGAAYTKEDWAASGILQMLCDVNKNGGRVSITAWDLPSSADGAELVAAFDAMSAQAVLSGRPVIMVTPSASGKAIVNLAALKVKAKGARNDLLRMVKAWIAVAPPAIVHAQDIVLHQFQALRLPTLAINGDRDEQGRKATNRLVNLISAKGVELPGPHAVYLESPTEFVDAIVQFLVENGL